MRLEADAPKVTVTVSLPPDTRDWLHAQARREDRKVSAVVRRAIEELRARETSVTA